MAHRDEQSEDPPGRDKLPRLLAAAILVALYLGISCIYAIWGEGAALSSAAAALFIILVALLWPINPR